MPFLPLYILSKILSSCRFACMAKLMMRQGTTAEVYLHGAHVTSFKPASKEEVIFVSKHAIFEPPKAIRGGIPVCWPHFNDMGPGPAHGFARNSQFKATSVTQSKAVLELEANEKTHATFPHQFVLTVTVEVSDDNGGTLKQTLAVKNNSEKVMKTTQALHTYYGISNVAHVCVKGLEGVSYLDNTDRRQLKAGAEGPTSVDQFIDRIYQSNGREVILEDRGLSRKVVIKPVHFSDAVVWNPWAENAKKMADLGDEEYQEMLCIEPANASLFVRGECIEVAPGGTWSASQEIHVEKL